MTLYSQATDFPNNITELMLRANALAGLTLGDIAQQHGVNAPKDLKKHKGWAGQLIELALGASAGSKPLQDFPALNVELKTLPINQQNQPLETTYVCYAPLTNTHHVTWETSNVKNKLSQVLWIPVLAERSIPPSERMVGSPILWVPTAQDDSLLASDWNELMDLITLGKVEQISAHHGVALQLRPKAANGKALTDAYGESGELIKTRPRGFYLRKSFTQAILDNYFA